jgi:GTP cyclohydrolase I
MIDTVTEVLQTFAGLNPESDHGKETAQRFVQMLDELTKCKSNGNYEQNKQHIQNCIKWKLFNADKQDMIVIEKIPFVSLCNHHLVPFMGHAHIGYVPQEKIAGLSKFARVVKHFARQLQVQEGLTNEIADFLEEKLEQPKGVAVVIRAEHMCMTIRGVHALGTVTTTSAMRGVFADHARTAKSEYMQIISGSLR